MIRPSGWVPLLLLGVAGVALAVALLGVDPLVWKFVGAAAGGFLLVDLALLRQPDGLEAMRRLPHSLPVNRWSTATIFLRHRLSRPLSVRIYEELPAAVATQGLPATVVAPPGETLRIEYGLHPGERGDLTLGRTLAVLRSPLGCWERKRWLGAAGTVRVYPDFSIITRYLGMLPDQRSTMLGIRKGQRRGEGLEFHQLREYRFGDVLRQVDWKATSRRRELISREYQEERDQQILFLLDSGRRMRSREGELSHFDHALNAMLLLAYIALRQGDAVGVMAFGAHDQWVPAVRGAPAINRLLNAVYGLDSGPVASDYVAAAEQVMSRQRKRTLVVLMTNLREEDEDLGPALKLLRRRHLVLLANLKEQALTDTLAGDVNNLDDALRHTGIVHYLNQRAAVQRTLHPLVDLLIDSTPAELPIRVVNGYWQIKRTGLL